MRGIFGVVGRFPEGWGALRTIININDFEMNDIPLVLKPRSEANNIYQLKAARKGKVRARGVSASSSQCEKVLRSEEGFYRI